MLNCGLLQDGDALGRRDLFGSLNALVRSTRGVPKAVTREVGDVDERQRGTAHLPDLERYAAGMHRDKPAVGDDPHRKVVAEVRVLERTGSERGLILEHPDAHASSEGV